MRYPSDIQLPDMLWVKMLRSPHARARIVSIDVSAAKALPGVVDVVTHEDMPPRRWGRTAHREGSDILEPEVAFVGDGVAAVAATDWVIAEEAARLIRVEYAVLPAVLDPEEGAQPDAPQIHPLGNVIDGNAETPTTRNVRGDVDQGLAESDVIVQRVFRQPQASGVPHEPRTCVASWDGETLTLWDSGQHAHDVKAGIAHVLDLPQDRVRVLSANIGGGFGVKKLSRCAFLAAILAVRTGRPVKFWFTREEETLDSVVRPGVIHHVTAGATREGEIKAWKITSYMDSGHWTGVGGSSGPALARDMCRRAMDFYNRCPNVQWDVFLTRTNHPKSGPFRGRTSAEAYFSLDSVVDELAERIGMDPGDLRIKNTIRTGEPLLSTIKLPTGRIMEIDPRTVTPKRITLVGYEECIEAGKRAIGWERRNPVPGHDPGPVKRGIGMAAVMHSAGGTPILSKARVEIDGAGRIAMFTGTSDQGAEQQTTLRQIAAEILGVALGDVGGVNADTDLCPYDAGPVSSRTIYCTGTAVSRAAEAAKEQLLALGADRLALPAERLELREGAVVVRERPEARASFAELVEANGAPVEGAGAFNPDNSDDFVYGFAATFAEVAVDVELGRVRVLRLISAHDVGRAINPLIVEGQIEGGVAQGLGYALSEGLVYDPKTGGLLNQWFLDLRTPSSLDLPDVEPIILELADGDPSHPFGAKGCSEIPLVGVAPAVANAIYNAVGVRMTELPITPDRLLAALAQAGRGS
jgi:CO/xanthine dehydrogenase Mo-binding subunit